MNSDEIYMLTKLIAQRSKTHAKMQLLNRDELLLKVLRYTYDPKKKYYIKKIPDDWKGTGKLHFGKLTFRLLEVLSRRTLSGNAARKAIHNYLKSLTPASAELFKSILLKDLRCGINVGLINKRFPNLIYVHKIMKAEPFNPERIIYPCYVSPKIEGYRATRKNSMFISSGGYPYHGLDHLNQELYNIHAILDGELIIPRIEFNVMGGMLRSENPCPTAEYWVFDCPSMHDHFAHRYFGLTTMLQDMHKIKIIRHVLMYDLNSIMAYYDKCRSLGFEGVMVKSRYHMYQNKRSWDWMKLKPDDTEDLRCVDIYEGAGKYRGKLGGIVVNRNGVQTNIGSGFSDQERNDYYNNPNHIIGRTCEILFMEGTKTGKLRHSSFIRVRYDK